MMACALPLENFGAPPEPDINSTKIDEAYQRGYDEGIQAGQEATQRLEQQARDAILQVLSDIEISYDEARLATLESLTPLFQTIAEKLIPAAAQTMLLGKLMEMFQSAAEKSSEAAARIAIGPEGHTALMSLFEQVVPTRIALDVDPALGPEEARFSTAGAECLLDVSLALEAIQDALRSISNDEKKECS